MLAPETSENDSALPWRRSWRSQRRAFQLGTALGIITIIAVAGSIIRVPKIAFKPSGVNATEELVTVTGTDSFPSEGEVFFTTVRVQDLSLWGWLEARYDGDDDVQDEELIRQGQTTEESRVCSQTMMQLSKSTAVVVALTRLGYDVVTSTGSGIERVFDGSAADGVLTCGDVIVAIDDEPVLQAEDAVRIIGGYLPGDVVAITVETLDGESRVEQVELGANEAGGAMLGVQPQTRFDEQDLPFDVEIDTGQTGGPSAGLAFTLAVIDKLSDGDLAGDLDVAVTGTIRVDGSVGNVGGVRQKVIGARKAGVAAFIMPAQPRCADPENPNCPFDDAWEAILESAGDLPIFEVVHFEEALDVLAELGGDPIPAL